MSGPGERPKAFAVWRSLTVRLTALVGVGLLAISVVTTYLAARAERDALLGELTGQAERLADLLAASVATPLFAFDDHGVGAVVSSFAKDSGVRMIEVRDKAGQVIKATDSAGGQRASLIFAQRPVRAGREVVGSVGVGFSREAADRAVALAWRRLFLREVTGLVLLFVLIGWLVRREVAKPLADLDRTMHSIQERRDLSIRLGAQRTREIDGLARRFDGFADDLASVLQSVAETAGAISPASRKLAEASLRMATGAQAQAAALQESSASLEALTTTVKLNADHAGQAAQLAGTSRDAAERGGEVVAAAVASMQDITQASKRIADIISVIDDIAFQTNLLALNAAVEAARAGEQGRGFAVVAAEVRNLAQRSAGAAKEIKTLIQDSVAKVQEGSALVNKSGQTLEDIVQSAKRVADIVAAIAAACQEQSSGIDQVNRAVAQVDRVTQDNAAQTGDLSFTSQALAVRAQEMLAVVSRFTLLEHQAAALAGGESDRRPSKRAGSTGHIQPAAA